MDSVVVFLRNASSIHHKNVSTLIRERMLNLLWITDFVEQLLRRCHGGDCASCSFRLGQQKRPIRFHIHDRKPDGVPRRRSGFPVRQDASSRLQWENIAKKLMTDLCKSARVRVIKRHEALLWLRPFIKKYTNVLSPCMKIQRLLPERHIRRDVRPSFPLPADPDLFPSNRNCDRCNEKKALDTITRKDH